MLSGDELKFQEEGVLKDKIIVDDRIADRSIILENALRAACALDSIGIGEGDRVAILMRNDFPYFEANRGIATIGGYSVPLNWHNKSDEIGYVLDDSKPKALVAHSDVLMGVRDAIPDDIKLFLVPVHGDTSSLELARKAFPQARIWSEWIAGFEPWTEAPRPPRNAIIYTSGTTGRPKAVQKPAMAPEQLAEFLRQMRQIFGIEAGARALVLGPLYHSSPDASARNAINEAEITAVQSKFDAECMLRTIHEHRITNIVCVPTVFVRLLKLPTEIRTKYDVSSLKSVTHTGGPCPPEIKRQMIEWFGPVINEVYGGTEMGCVYFCRSSDWLRYPGTVGLPLEGTRCRIVGEDGTEVPTGQVGEIYARNPAFGDFTYVGRPDQRRDVEVDGLITLGDMGYANDEGFLFLCDRKRDMVISGGVNLYPAEIESVLLTHSNVRDCAVFGVPDDDLGESMIAAVQLKPGATETEVGIHSFLKARLSNYKVPGKIEFHAELPREDSGKIFKRKLRDPYWVGREKAI